MSGCACGCCAGVHEATPRLTTNRHGLAAIARRTGDYNSFLRSMLGTIAGTSVTREDNSIVYPLTRLTRDRDDFSIALLDAWATTADVLTFYQERIANESYLRTAGERLSVVELTRLIGYELAPGVAASAWLAFTVDDAEGAPGEVTLEAGTKVQSVPAQDETPQTFETAELLDARAEWNVLVPRSRAPRAAAEGDLFAYFAGTETNLAPGNGLLFYRDASHWDFRRVATVAADFDENWTIVTWADALTANVTGGVTIHAFRVQANLFGHNAPDPRTLSKDTHDLFAASITDDDWTFAITNGQLFLEGEQLAVHEQSFAIVRAGTADPVLYTVSAVAQLTKSEFAMSGKATELAVTPATTNLFHGTAYRATVVFTASELLPLAEAPLHDALSQTIELDRRITALDAGRTIIISNADGSVAEVATIDEAGVSASFNTTLRLAAAPTNSYDVATARIFANVVLATHGETLREVLGSGDTPTPFQRFALSHVPLTYVHSNDAVTTTGVQSTLQVYVNDILWSERPSLYGAATNARVYETMRDAEERTFVQFGDGRTEGAAVPTGHDNVRAIYRAGLGSAGVAKKKLTLLMSQPLGLEGVDNPLSATGGADPETLEAARENAPGTVRTLDRVVSLADYEDFASSFAGIAKAIATWSFAGTESQVFLTVAGADGATFAPNDPTIDSLRTALLNAGDPFVPLRIVSFLPAPFRVAAKVGVDADRIAEIVLQQVRDALATAFSFDARGFAEAVDLSDLVAVMHSVAGVKSVDVDLLHRSDASTASRQERLSAAKPRQLNGTLYAAEILILDQAAITEAR
ncbi:MAG TPA: putative baseplate assembly protein [Thermoanaerobaculia bacterium]|nr:putative baseplate assembly protein [Thermoanaerobaculia bacterium]